MLDIEIVGNAKAIAVIKKDLAVLLNTEVREYEEKAAVGTADIFGLIASIPISLLTKVLEILHKGVRPDRNLILKVGNKDGNSIEITVRDIKEASAVLSLLESRGLIKPE